MREIYKNVQRRKAQQLKKQERIEGLQFAALAALGYIGYWLAAAL